jgi:hypothetical protein
MQNLNELMTGTPASADFSCASSFGTRIICRKVRGEWEQVARIHDDAWSVFAAGVSAHRKSLWDNEAKQFVCGPVYLMAEDFAA